jgi:phospholipase D1/2
LLSCTISYFLGMALGKESLNALFGKYADNIRHYAHKGGVMGLTMIRLVPSGPFTAQNLILGMIKVPYSTLMISTLLGMLPGTIIFIYLGKAALDLLKNPDPEKLILTITGVVVWIALIWFTHYITNQFKKKI